MKHLLLASLITLLAFGTACGQASEPEPEPVASDGIQVHGHWTVTVTNPDGTVDAVHEFDNELSNLGGSILTGLLSSETAVSGWLIKVKQPMNGRVDYALKCQEHSDIFSEVSYMPASVTRNLLKNTNPLMISGTCTIETTEPTVSISEVYAYLHLTQYIDMRNLYGVDINLDRAEFTEHVLENEITAVNGQIISINIEISFS